MTIPEIQSGKWTVDPVHSRIGFIARHLMVTKVHGSFTDFTADLVVGADPVDSKVSVTVQMESIETGNKDRDGHLRTNDFFDVPQFPTMTFESTKFAVDGKKYTMTGDLTLKGVTKPVTFDLEYEGTTADPWGGTRAGVYAEATIDRKEWGVKWNAPLETGGVAVGDKVQIELDIQLVKEADA